MSMSAVIEFPLDRRRRTAATAAVIAGEVLIFPGVRMERMEFSLADRLPLRASRPTAQAKPLEDYDGM